MPRNGSGVMSWPSGGDAVSGATIESAKYNTRFADLLSDLNTARPLSAGGTGASLSDPGADRLMGWDDSAGTTIWYSLGTGLSTDGTSIELDSDLETLAGLTVAADNFIAGNSGGTAWEVKTPAQARTSLGLVLGTDVQAYDDFLNDIAALSDPNDDRILFWDDSAGAITWLDLGSNLQVSGTTLSPTGLLVGSNNLSDLSNATTSRDNLGLGDIATKDLSDSFAFTGAVTFSQDVNFDSNTLFVDVSANFVGVGTNTPSAKLHVAGDGLFADTSGDGNVTARGPNNSALAAEANNGSLYTVRVRARFAEEGFSLLGGSEYKIFASDGFATPNNIKFFCSDTEQMRLTTTGLGIGTNSPAENLVVSDTTAGATTTIQIMSSNTGEGEIRFGDTDDGDIGKLWYDHTSNYLRIDVNNAERMRIDNAGNVGIGTTTPDCELDVDGEIKGRVRISPDASGTLDTDSANTTIQLTGNPTINGSVFSAGDMIVMYAGSTSRTITQGSGITLRLDGTSTSGSRTLAARGMALVFFVSATEAVVSGAAVS